MFFETTKMGITTDLALVQKTIIDTLHKEGMSQRVITERAGCSRSAVSKHIKCKVENVMLPSADQFFKDADFIFQQDLAPAHTAKGTKSWFNYHGVTVLDWPANSPDLNPIENLWGIVKRKMRDTRPNNPDDLKSALKATWASITHEQCHRLIASMPRRIDAVIRAKGGPTKYWVHRNEHTFQKP